MLRSFSSLCRYSTHTYDIAPPFPLNRYGCHSLRSLRNTNRDHSSSRLFLSVVNSSQPSVFFSSTTSNFSTASSSVIFSTVSFEKQDKGPIKNSELFTPEDEEYMRYALQLATEAGKQNEVPIGAVVVGYDKNTSDSVRKKSTRSSNNNKTNDSHSTIYQRSGRILGTGTNATRTQKNVTAHAEIIALQSAQLHESTARLDHVTLFVTVEPCIMCLGACLLHHIQRIVYAAPSPKFGYFTGHVFSSTENNHQSTVPTDNYPERTTEKVRRSTENSINAENTQPRHWPTPFLAPDVSYISSSSSSSFFSFSQPYKSIYNHRIRVDPYPFFRDEAIHLLQHFFQNKRGEKKNNEVE